MTLTVVIMIIIGIIFIFASFFLTESLTKKQDNFSADLLTVNDNYEFSEREKGIIKRKVEDAIAQQARDILYETNESLANMANEKTMALGDYAVTVCEEIERNHKEVMFLYSMLEDKQKDIMNTVGEINKSQEDAKKTIAQVQSSIQNSKKEVNTSKENVKANSVSKKESRKETVVKTKEIAKQTNPKTLEAMAGDTTEEILKNETQSAEDVVANTAVKEAPISEDKKIEANGELTNPDSDEKVEESILESVSVEEALETGTNELDELLDSFDMETVDLDDVLEEEFEKSSNSNDIILEMYRNGDSILAIAKALGLGVGEVKLVIDLYQGE